MGLRQSYRHFGSAVLVFGAFLLQLPSGHAQGTPKTDTDNGPYLRPEDRPTLGEGVVIYRNKPFDSDRFALALAFKKREPSAIATNYYVGTASPFLVPNGSVVALVLFEDLETRNLLTDADRASVAEKAKTLADLSTRCPNAAPLLKSRLTALNGCLENLAAQQVRVNQKWMLRTEYYAMLQAQAAQQEAKEMAQKKAEEDKKMAEQAQVYAEEARAKVLAQREANLRYNAFSMGARHLVSHFTEVKQRMERSSRIRDKTFVATMNNWPQNPVLLPAIGALTRCSTMIARTPCPSASFTPMRICNCAPYAWHCQ